MSERRAVLETKRILVALDTSSRGRAALAAAVRLAAKASAELDGLFVEDEDLLRLASLPFAHEVDLTSASPRQLQLTIMERELHAAAQQAQQAFANALGQLDLKWTFRIVRGTITQASLAAAGDVDLLVIGQQGRSSRVMAGEYPTRRSAGSNRVVAVFDGSPSAFRAIELGHSLAEPNVAELTVLVLANNGDQRSEQCLAWLEEHRIRAELNQVIGASDQPITDFVRKYRPAILLINRDSESINDWQIGRLVNEFDCPIILC